MKDKIEVTVGGRTTEKAPSGVLFQREGPAEVIFEDGTRISMLEEDARELLWGEDDG